MFVALALVVALEREPEPLPTLLALIGAVLALLARAVRGRHGGPDPQPPQPAGQRVPGHRLRAVVHRRGAIPSIVIFICASAGLLSAAAADNVAVWAGVGLLGALGVAAGRWPASPCSGAYGTAWRAGPIGALIVALKVAVKKI